MLTNVDADINLQLPRFRLGVTVALNSEEVKGTVQFREAELVILPR